MDRIILHVDMDSFFAAIEQHLNPSLIGLPVVVGSDPKGGRGRGVVSTCSYEARAYGIHSAMPISRAYKLCPDAVFLPVNMPLYLEVSGRIMEILMSYADRFEQSSVDEAFLDISDSVQDFEEARQTAVRIKLQIKSQEGLTCSIGIAPNRALAKIASDMNKPDGLTAVRPDEVERFLEPLDVRRLSGVGKKNEELLHGMGIRTIGQLARFDRQKLIETFGKWGERMHMLACGRDDSEVRQKFRSRSVSSECTFVEDTADPEALYRSLDSIAEKVHTSLIDRGYSFGTVAVKVRQADFTTYTRAKTLQTGIQDLGTIRRIAKQLGSEFFDGRKIRLLGIKLSGLSTDKMIQTTLAGFMQFD